MEKILFLIQRFMMLNLVAFAQNGQPETIAIPNWDEFTAVGVAAAQQNQNVVIYRTQHLNIGFGKASNCSTNQFMDFCVNGSLVGQNGLPVGGYINNGVQKQNWVSPESGGGNFSVGNGIFGLGFDGKLYMVSYEERNQIPAMKWAFQNGPMLVRDGVNIRGTSQSQCIRSGIGYKNDGTVVVIISLEKITFRQFAELFVNEGCVNAIYLDGESLYVGYSNKQSTVGMQPQAMKIQFFNN